MKIALVGNQDNNAYRLCKWVREHGEDAHLYMMRQEQGPRSKPELVDPQLADEGYPPWVRQYDDAGQAESAGPRHPAFVRCRGHQRRPGPAGGEPLLAGAAGSRVHGRRGRRVPVEAARVADELALARGKRQYDKRAAIAKREDDRRVRRAMREHERGRS